MKRLTSKLAASLLACALAHGQNRAHFAAVELVGPVSDVVLDAGALGSTRLEGQLLAGESRRLIVPVPLDSDIARSEPTVRFDSTSFEADPAAARGRVRFVGFTDAVSPLAALPAGLRARSLPALEEARVRVSRAAPLVLVSALVVALALRRKPVLALATALAAGAVLFPLVALPARAAEAAVTLLDGDASSALWRRIDAALDSVGVTSEAESFELTSEPPAAPITWRVPLDTSLATRALARDARLFVASVVDVGEAGITFDRNGFGPLAQTWVREEGTWREHGAWLFGARLGPAIGTGSPPGWLASHLPQGVPMLIARTEPVAGRAPEWLRLSGL